MKIKYYIIIFFLLCSCCDEETTSFQTDIRMIEGQWGRIIEGTEHLEEVYYENIHFGYKNYNAASQVIEGSGEGNVLVGNEKIIRWYYYSPFSDKSMNIYWKIINCETNKMVLNSNSLGERNYYRICQVINLDRNEEVSLEEYLEEKYGAICTSYNSNIVEILPGNFIKGSHSGTTYIKVADSTKEYLIKVNVSDGVQDILQFSLNLPSHARDLESIYGTYNVLRGEGMISYKINSPFLDQIDFLIDTYTDSIRTFCAHITPNKFSSYLNRITQNLYPLQEKNGVIDYTDQESFTESNYIISSDSLSASFTYYDLKTYNLWIDMSSYLYMNIEQLKKQISNYYYLFQTEPNGIRHYTYYGLFGFNKVRFEVDENDIVRNVNCYWEDSEYNEEIVTHSLAHKYYLGASSEDYDIYISNQQIENSLFALRHYKKMCMLRYSARNDI